MKTTKQRKGKTVETPKKHNAIVGCAGVKKSANRTGGRHQRTAVGRKCILAEDDPGILPFSAAPVVGQQLPRSCTLAQGTTKEIPKLEPKTGLHPCEKIRLQLFPIDEGTRQKLEKDGHNPFLELTLGARKKISSVLKHLNSKWGNSSVAQGDPMLFPHNSQFEKLSTCKRWTLCDSGISAGDIYAALGSPAFFRLCYGWFSNLDPETLAVPSTSTHWGDCFESEGLQEGCSTISGPTAGGKEKLQRSSEDFKPISTSKEADTVVTKNVSSDVPIGYVEDEVKTSYGGPQSLDPWDDSLNNLSIGALLSDTSLLGKISNCKSEGNRLSSQPIQLISSDISISGLFSEASLQGRFNNHEQKSNGSKLGLQPTVDKDLVQSSLPWDDSLTNLSIGGLLSEASLLGMIDSCDPKSNGSKLGLQSTPLISDSWDAFIAGQLNSQPQESKLLSHVPHSSILDAEETCHAFPFRKLSSSGNNAVRVIGGAIPRDHSHDGSSKSFKISNFAQLNNGQGELAQESRSSSSGNQDNSCRSDYR